MVTNHVSKSSDDPKTIGGHPMFIHSCFLDVGHHVFGFWIPKNQYDQPTIEGNEKNLPGDSM